MNVLIACEESQEICKAFRERGHRAFSADLQECSGGHPEWHILGDVLPLINGNCEFTLQNRERERQIGRWDLIIAHPPCTNLCVTGQIWFKKSPGEKGYKDPKLKEEAAEFFMKFINADCDRIAVENPVRIMSSRYKKPTQIINPYQFGHPEQKKTCLWLKGLPPLKETNNVYEYMMTLPVKQRCRIWWMGSKPKERSKTYHGIAQAIAEQWGGTSEKFVPVQLSFFD